MKKIFLLSIFAYFLSPLHAQRTLLSQKEKINILVNGKSIDWMISPEVNPDRLRVYCSKEKNKVIFETDIDTAVFTVSNKDTIRFRIILRSKDTANTEIIGIRDFPAAITRDEKIYWLSQLWSETKYNFVNIDRLGFSIDSLYRSFIPVVLATRNDYEYYRELQKFMAYMHDGHTQVSDDGQFFPYMDYIPVSLDDFNKKVYITLVRKIPGLDSTWVGAELVGVDGMPTARYLDSGVFPYISASTEQHKWMQGIEKLQSGPKDGIFRGKIKKRDGTIEEIAIPRNGEEIRTPGDRYWGPKYSYPAGPVELKWRDQGIAVVNFSRFYPEEEAMKDFDKIVNDLYGAKGIIIDLRQNGGGSTEVAWHLQKYLTKSNYFLNYAWETRMNDGTRKANGNWIEEDKDYFLNSAYRFVKPDTIFVPDSIKRLDCPVVILIGRYTFSAAEDFLVNMYELPGRPLFIGEETGGSTGSPLVVPGLPGDGYARICTRRICYPVSFKRFANCGIRPDIEVKRTIEDYLESRDPVLERALTELARAMPPVK